MEAARQLDISLNRLNEIVLGKRGITADTALRLARLLKTSPQFWMRLPGRLGPPSSHGSKRESLLINVTGRLLCSRLARLPPPQNHDGEIVHEATC